MINVDYPHLLDLFREHLDPKRTESASFLIWHLQNYYRLDEGEAVDSVCDQKGDKGVDGIFVNDNDRTVTVFQSRINQSPATSIGDVSLKEFAGTLMQFATPDSIAELVKSGGKATVASLAQRLDLINKISTHELRGEFLSNVETDANGKAFLKNTPNITFVGKARLQAGYISDERAVVIHKPAIFDIAGFLVTQYAVDVNTNAAIAPIKASELVTLDGISDQSLFAFNVRGPLGKTGVNRDIVKSINDPKLHKLFPLFHNVITVICRKLDVGKDTIEIEDYHVVNGCQSLTALFDNGNKLTENLRVLTKFIKMEPASPLAGLVTHFSNNQNGVTERDFMANNAMQIRLQNEFRQNYANQYFFEIKRGEVRETGTVISNEDAGLFLMAFDLKEPWATHRKYQVFAAKHSELFGRPEVTADRIVLCQVIKEAIDDVSSKISNSLLAKYRLTRYLLLYIVREALEKSDLDVIKNPQSYVRTQENRDHFRKCILTILSDVIVDLNAEVEGIGVDFDYRDKLRDSDWIRALARTVIADYLKLVNRKRIKSFSDDWKERPQAPAYPAAVASPQ